MEYRTKNGKFKSVDDLVNVKGIGKKMLQKLKGQVKIS
jgi:competence protein ComEA